MTPTAEKEARWISTGDGFSLCKDSLETLLHKKGIVDTGLSPINKTDVDAYFDDWHLYRVNNTYSLIKLREQEHDFVPGYADRDDPSVTVSFVAFPIALLEALPFGCGAEADEMKAFVNAFRDATERLTPKHDPVLQSYFSNPRSKGSYCIAESYVKKLLALFPNGRIPFPDKSMLASPRLRKGLEAINRKAGREIVCREERVISVPDPKHPTLLEKQAILGFYTGDLSFCGFASEVKFHADALVSWQRKVPLLGNIWYRAALRADMQFGPEYRLYDLVLCPYYHPNSKLYKEQQALHGNI